MYLILGIKWPWVYPMFKGKLPINTWSWGTSWDSTAKSLPSYPDYNCLLCVSSPSSRDQKMLRLREKRSKHWPISKLSIKISLYKVQNFHSRCMCTLQVYDIAMVRWILYPYSEDRCVCMWMYKCLREMITGDIFFLLAQVLLQFRWERPLWEHWLFY